MRLRSIIKLFAPPIVMEGFYALREKFAKVEESPLPQIEHSSKEFIVVGNGPSLKKSIAKYKDAIVGKDMVVVNGFASTDLYKILKPNIYMMTDPVFYNLQEDKKETMLSIINDICEKTTWPLHVILHSSAKDKPIVALLLRNKYIKIDFFLSGSYVTNKKISKYESWDKNLCAPCGQTVLNTAVYLALFWNYKEIYLLGADASFFEDIRIDQETNEIWTVDSHFYDNNRIYKDKGLFDKMKGRLRDDITLHELIYRYGRMFESYYTLADYARYKGANVYNASEYSWINVFERKKLQ